MAFVNSPEFEDDFRKVGSDVTAGFEPTGAPSNPTEHASSENLGAAAAVADEDDDLEEDEDLDEEDDEEDEDELDDEDDLEDDEDPVVVGEEDEDLDEDEDDEDLDDEDEDDDEELEDDVK